jgi:hypothetical protein
VLFADAKRPRDRKKAHRRPLILDLTVISDVHPLSRHSYPSRLTHISTDPRSHTSYIISLITSSQILIQTTPDIKALTNQSDTQVSQPSEPSSSQTIPWTIVNKYYTADVHFELREIREWNASHAEGVPAIVFAWSNGEVMYLSTALNRCKLMDMHQPYKNHIVHLSKELDRNGLEPQVSLAVRTSQGTAINDDDDDDDEGVDEFLSSNGFEFIDIRDVEDKSESEPTTTSLPDQTLNPIQFCSS